MKYYSLINLCKSMGLYRLFGITVSVPIWGLTSGSFLRWTQSKELQFSLDLLHTAACY